MTKEFWKTQTHALVISSIYYSIKRGEICEICSVKKLLVTLKSNRGPTNIDLPFRFIEVVPVSSLLKELV